MQAKEIKIKFEKCESSGYLFSPSKSNNIGILFVHGWGSSKDQFYKRALMLCEKGFTSLTFDMCGFGQTKTDLTKISPRDHKENLLSAYKVLEKIKLKKIIVCGFSYGGFITALASENKKIKSIILNAPVIYEDKLINKSLWEKKRFLSWVVWHKTDGDFKNLEAIKNIANFRGDLLVIGAEMDEIASENVLNEYFKAAIKAKSRKIIWIEGANHLLTGKRWQEKFVTILSLWAKEKNEN